MKLKSRLLHSTIHHVMWYFWVFTVNPFSLSCIFFSRKWCFLWFLFLWLIAELISLDTSGKPTVGFFLKITFPTWIIFPISLDKINSIDWFWKADNEFSWNFIFCFIVVKEFCYGKKNVFWRICLNISFWIFLWMLTPLVIWNLNITVIPILKYCYKKALNKKLKLIWGAM